MSRVENGLRSSASSVNEKKDDMYSNQQVTVDAGEIVVPREQETIRALKPRQISMIAIGGAIG
jgi:amino acid permease